MSELLAHVLELGGDQRPGDRMFHAREKPWMRDRVRQAVLRKTSCAIIEPITKPKAVFGDVYPKLWRTSQSVRGICSFDAVILFTGDRQLHAAHTALPSMRSLPGSVLRTEHRRHLPNA